MTTVLPGLCSISFRTLDSDTVLRMSADAGLLAVEWGSDVHAPPGDLAEASNLARRCRDAGMICPSYGSYFFAGKSEVDELEALFDTAEALGASTLRIWAQFGTVQDSASEERAAVADGVREAGARAAGRGLAIGLEFHPGTLTETAASTIALLDGAGSNVFTYWQPVAGAKTEDSLAELERVQDRLAHLHVFSWDPTPAQRRPLDHLEPMWRAALRQAARERAFPAPRCAFLEYLPADDPEALRRDAAVLASWIREE